MPITLENSHSHSFGYLDADGVMREVTVRKGQDIEPLDIPIKRLTQLLSEYVVSFDGQSRRPRYKYSEEVTEEDGSTYTSGVITQTLVNRQLDKKDAKKNPLSREELAKLQADAEAAEEAEARADLRESTELANAAQEQAEREAAENAARAEAAEAKLATLQAAMVEQAKSDKAEAAKPKSNTPTARRGPGRPKADGSKA